MSLCVCLCVKVCVCVCVCVHAEKGSLSSRYRTGGVCLLFIDRRRKLDCQTAKLAYSHTATLSGCQIARLPGCQTARLHDCQIATPAKLPLSSLSGGETLSPLYREGVWLLPIEERAPNCHSPRYREERHSLLSIEKESGSPL